MDFCAGSIIKLTRESIQIETLPLLCANISVDSNLHSPERRLIELRIEHADLDAMSEEKAPGASRRDGPHRPGFDSQ